MLGVVSNPKLEPIAREANTRLRNVFRHLQERIPG
jgi:hypothetical protein